MIHERFGAFAAFERRHHRAWMIGSVVFVWCLWVVPFLLLRVASDNESWYTALLAVTAVVIGIGRQGLDVLALRLFGSALAVVATVHVTCSGFGDCFNAYEWVIPGLGLFLTVLMWMVAVPVNIAWNWGVTSLAPELPWHRLAQLKT
ncbi:MAG TPA: hypothetical protein VF221_01380, partial [Chloroflexota bacterium]